MPKCQPKRNRLWLNGGSCERMRARRLKAEDVLERLADTSTITGARTVLWAIGHQHPGHSAWPQR